MKKRMDDKEKEVHKSVLKDLMKNMEDEMHGEMAPRGVKKVTVMAKDKKGMEQGLDKAKEIMDGMPGKESDDIEDPCKECLSDPCECSDMSSPAHESSDESIESLKAKIKELESQLSQK